MIPFRKKLISFFIALLSIIGYGVVVFATQLPAGTLPPSGGYHAGDSILDPGCAPGSVNCFQNTGVYIGQPVGAGNPGQILYTDANGKVFGDNDFARDSVSHTTFLLDGNAGLNFDSNGTQLGYINNGLGGQVARYQSSATGNTLEWDADTSDGLLDLFVQGQNIGGTGIKGTGFAHVNANTGEYVEAFTGDATAIGGQPFQFTANWNDITGEIGSSITVSNLGSVMNHINGAINQVGFMTTFGGGNLAAWYADTTSGISTTLTQSQDILGLGFASGSALTWQNTNTNITGLVGAIDGSMSGTFPGTALLATMNGTTGSNATIGTMYDTGSLESKAFANVGNGTYDAGFNFDSGKANILYRDSGSGQQSIFSADGSTISMEFSPNGVTSWQTKLTDGLFEFLNTTTNNNYLELDVPNKLYRFGDIDKSNQGTYIAVDDATKQISFNFSGPIQYRFPATNGTGVLSNDGSGGLTWGPNGLLNIDNCRNLYTGSISAGVSFDCGGGGIDNIAFGHSAGANTTTGIYNVFIGESAGSGNQTGFDNIFIGAQTGVNGTSGIGNIFFNQGAGYSNTGNFNIFAGGNSGYNIASGSRNVFLGYETGKNYLSSMEQVAIGVGALRGSITLANNTGYENTAIGFESLTANESGYDNTVLGYQAAMNNVSGHAVTAFGAHAAGGNTVGNDNLAFGTYALNGNITSSGNIGIGNNALYLANAGNNLAVGHYAGSATTGGQYNLFVGNNAGLFNMNGQYNQYIGFQAGNSVEGSDNTALGLNAGAGAPGATYNRSVSVGNYAGQGQSSFGANTLVGWSAGTALTGGNSVMVGYEAGYATTNPWSNVMIGYQAGLANIGGSNNMYLGALSGSANTSGSYNVAIGDTAGANSQTGSSNIFLGSNSSVSADGWNASIAIGREAQITKSNQMVIGSQNYPVDEISMVSTGGTSCAVDINGTACSSDERLKTNIADLSNDILSGLTQVRTVTFNWKEGADTDKHIGFIAQDLEKQYPELVSTAANGYLQVNYAGMAPILTEAIRELNVKVTSIQNFSDSTFKQQLIAWLGDSANGILNIFSKKLTTEKICVTDQNGETCLDRSQINNLLMNAANYQGQLSSPSNSTGSSTPAPTDSNTSNSNDTTDTGTVTTDTTVQTTDNSNTEQTDIVPSDNSNSNPTPDAPSENQSSNNPTS